MKGLMIWFAMVCYAMLLDFKKNISAYRKILKMFKTKTSPRTEKFQKFQNS